MGHAPPLRCDGSSRRRAAARAGAVRKDAAPARGKGRRRPKVGRRRAFGVVAAANHGPRAPLRCDGSGKRRAAARAGGVRKGVTATAGEKGGRPKAGVPSGVCGRFGGVPWATLPVKACRFRAEGGDRKSRGRPKECDGSASRKGGRRPEKGGVDRTDGIARPRNGYLSAAGPSGGVSAGSNAASKRASASAARRAAGGATVSISASAAR